MRPADESPTREEIVPENRSSRDHTPPLTHMHVHVTWRALLISLSEPQARLWQTGNLSFRPQLLPRVCRIALLRQTDDGVSRRVQRTPLAPFPSDTGCSKTPASSRCPQVFAIFLPSDFLTRPCPYTVALEDVSRLLDSQGERLIRVARWAGRVLRGCP